MPKEKYQPSAEEMKLTEEMMTEEQRKASEYREVDENWRHEIIMALRKDPGLLIDMINDLQTNHYANFRFEEYLKSIGHPPKSQKELTEAWFKNFESRLRNNDTSRGQDAFETQDLVREVKPDSMERMILALNLDTVYLTSHITHRVGDTEHLRLWKNPPNDQNGYPDWGSSGTNGIMATIGSQHNGAIHDEYLEAERVIRHLTDGPNAKYVLDKEDFFPTKGFADFRQKGYKQYKLVKKK